MKPIFTTLAVLALSSLAAFAEEPQKPIKVLFIAGTVSHGYGNHEYHSGSVFLGDYLRRYVSGQAIYDDEKTAPEIQVAIHKNARAGDTFAWDDADVVVVFTDGDENYPLTGQEEAMIKLREKGVGFVFLHYSLCGGMETPSAGTDFIREAVGGVYETYHSVNPIYIAEFPEFPEHPITRGVRPFNIFDEWYFHMRFTGDRSTDEILAANDDATSPLRAILVTVPPDETKLGEDGAHSGNPIVRAAVGKPEILAWAIQREDGGRGFGFSGLNRHWNLAHPDFRKILLQAILWTAHVDIPPRGIDTPTPTFEKLQEAIDEEDILSPERKARIRALIEAWPTEPRTERQP